MTITSPHNDHLKELRKLARRRERALSGRFIAEGEDLLAAADAAGWPAVERYCAAGSGLDGVEVEPDLLAGVSQLGSGTRALGVYEQRWADAPVGPLCVALHGISDPGNVGTILRSALAFGAASVALGTRLRRPVRTEGGARVDGRAVRGAACAVRRRRGAAWDDRRARCARAGDDRGPGGGGPAHAADRGRAGRAAGRRARRLRRRGPDPDPQRVAQRRDGRDGRALRGHARRRGRRA